MARPSDGAILALSRDELRQRHHMRVGAEMIFRGDIPMQRIGYRAADVGGIKISYREARSPDAPTLLLLRRFPSAGHMFRELIPLLAEAFIL